MALDIAPTSRENERISKQAFLILRALTTIVSFRGNAHCFAVGSFAAAWNAARCHFRVRGFCNNNPLTLTCETAKEAFAKAIEWHIIEKLSDISISEGTKSYTIAEFSLAMALDEISSTLDRER